MKEATSSSIRAMRFALRRHPHTPLWVDVPMLLWMLGLLVPLVLLWAHRIFYPFDLEWMEGGMLGHAWRIRHGLSLYDAPGTEFVPYVYPPGYAALVASLSTLFPLDYPLARCISLLGSCAAAAAIVWSGARQFRDSYMGFFGGGLFLLCYGGSGAFYDLARVDGLAIGLVAWSIVLGAEGSPRTRNTAAILLASVFFVKHTYALFGLPMALGIGARDGWRNAATFSATAAFPALLGTAGLQHVTHGAFLTYVIGVPSAHPIVVHQAFPGSFGEVALLLGIAWFSFLVLLFVKHLRSGVSPVVCLGIPIVCTAVLLALEPHLTWPVGVGLLDDSIRFATLVLVGASAGLLGLTLFRWRTLSWPWVYGAGVGTCAWFVAALMRGHQGGFMNVLMPAHWVVVMGMIAALAKFRADKRASSSYALLALVCCMQSGWALHRIDFDRLSPKTEDVALGRRIVAEIRHCQGPVLSPFAAWLPVQAGLAPSTHLIALWDIDHAGGPRQTLVSEFDAAIRNHVWGCIVAGGPPALGHGAEVAYPVVAPLQIPAEAFFPSTGWRARPLVIRRFIE